MKKTIGEFSKLGRRVLAFSLVLCIMLTSLPPTISAAEPRHDFVRGDKWLSDDATESNTGFREGKPNATDMGFGTHSHNTSAEGSFPLKTNAVMASNSGWHSCIITMKDILDGLDALHGIYARCNNCNKEYGIDLLIPELIRHARLNYTMILLLNAYMPIYIVYHFTNPASVLSGIIKTIMNTPSTLERFGDNLGNVNAFLVSANGAAEYLERYMCNPHSQLVYSGIIPGIIVEPVIKLDTPTVSLPSGTEVASGTAVQLISIIPVATIYYTTDGSSPISSPTRLIYTVPIVITGNTTIHAAAFLDGYEISDTATFSYTVTENYDYGDFTGNGYVDATDILWIRRYMMADRDITLMKQVFGTTTLDRFNELAADFTNNGIVDANDILWIQRYIVSGRDVDEMIKVFGTGIDFSHLKARSGTAGTAEIVGAAENA